MTNEDRLLAVRIVHTAVWVVVAGAIFALYPLIAFDQVEWFLGLHVLIGAEILVLFAYRWKCPLTYVAERYTERREPNFDIFLPAWLARWNKEVFTLVLVGAWTFAIAHWLL